MCIVYNEVGSLTYVKQMLFKNNINDFDTLDKIIDFHKNFEQEKEKTLKNIETEHKEKRNSLENEIKQLENLLEKEKEQQKLKLNTLISTLERDINFLKNEKPTGFFDKIQFKFKLWIKENKFKSLKNNYDKIVNKSIRYIFKKIKIKTNLYNKLDDKLLEKNIKLASEKLLKKKMLIDQLMSFVYGAIGEQKVVEILKNLSDDYYLINDFNISFGRAIYNKQTNEYIKSIQIDHIVVGPSGIFLIETKNWSDASIENLELRSPVEQIKRTSYALFVLLNNEIINSKIRMNIHHWGNKKISIKNIIVMINKKPKEEFQFVKVLTLNELLNYIKYFQPILSDNETSNITEFLLKINRRKVVDLN